MPNYSKPDVVLVRYPFSDLVGAKRQTRRHLHLAAQVYDGVCEREVNGMEQIAFDWSAFFTRPAR